MAEGALLIESRRLTHDAAPEPALESEPERKHGLVDAAGMAVDAAVAWVRSLVAEHVDSQAWDRLRRTGALEGAALAGTAPVDVGPVDDGPAVGADPAAAALPGARLLGGAHCRYTFCQLSNC